MLYREKPIVDARYLPQVVINRDALERRQDRGRPVERADSLDVLGGGMAQGVPNCPLPAAPLVANKRANRDQLK